MYMMHTCICTCMHYIIAHVYYVHDALRNYTCLYACTCMNILVHVHVHDTGRGNMNT